MSLHPSDVRGDENSSAELVRRLLAEQFPELAGRPLTPVARGWDNAVFRLGDDLAVRLPRRELAAALVEHEQRWLPSLAPALPLPVPTPVRAGRPSPPAYPWPWSVVPWFDGDIALDRPPAEDAAAADTLGRFVAALHRLPAPDDAPRNPFRGVPLADRTALFPDDSPAPVRRAWDELASTPAWSGPPLWVHGDLHPANVVVDHAGAVCAVIDFGDVTAGDPATDLMLAWMLFPDDVAARTTFRRAAGVDDDATWRRGAGWALAIGAALVAGSGDDDRFTALGRRTIAAVLADGEVVSRRRR